MPSQFFDANFIGMDTFHEPSKLDVGMLAQAENVLVDGSDLIVRPGKLGQLASALGGPIYGLSEFVDSDFSTKLLYTEGGKLYKMAAGDSAGSEIKTSAGASLSLVSANAFIERAGEYSYIIDGGGALLRTDLSAANPVEGLNAPADAPTATLAGVAIDELSTLSEWSSDSLASSEVNQVENAFSTHGAGHDFTSMADWTISSSSVSVDWHDSSGNPNCPISDGRVWLLCDTPGDSIETTDPITNFAQTLEAARCATSFYLSYDAVNTDAQARGSVIMTVAALDGSGGELGRLTWEQSVPGTGGQKQTFGHVFSFGDVGAQIASWKVIEVNGAGNQLNKNSIWITGIVGYPTCQKATFQSGLYLTVNLPQAVSGDPVSHIGGWHLRITPATAYDFSSTNIITLTMGPANASLTGLGFRLRLQKSGDATWYDTNPVTIADDGLSASVDLTANAIPADVRADCAKLEIVFFSDVTSGILFGPAQMQFGALTAAGELTVGRADYMWQVTEIDGTTDPTNLVNVIESNPSPLTIAVTPTNTAATGTLVLPAKTNSAATDFAIYRIGGGFSDGLARLVAIVSASSDATKVETGVNMTWNHATLTLVDNTPDGALLEADPVPTGHDPAPSGAQCIAYWQGRLCLAVGSRLYMSDLIEGGADAGLYFPALSAPDDPLAATKGANFTIGGDDNDPITAMLAYGSHLIVFKGRSVWVVTGVDASDFQAQSYLLKAGVGCIAKRGAAIIGNKIWFVSADGLYEFDADVVTQVSLAIEKTLALASSLANCALVYHNRRAHLFAPDSGSSDNSLCFVWDSRQDGWTKWTGMAITGAASLYGGEDGDLYLSGHDGQIYRMAGNADKTTPSADAAPIAWAVASRGGTDAAAIAWSHNAQGQPDPDRRYASTPNRVLFSVIAGESTTLTWGVKDADSSSAWTGTQVVSAGHLAQATLRPGGGIKAQFLQATLSGSSAAPFRLQGLGLQATSRRILR